MKIDIQAIEVKQIQCLARKRIEYMRLGEEATVGVDTIPGGPP